MTIKWNSMKDKEPEHGEILFIAKCGVCSERLGTAIPESRTVLLSHTDISFDDITHWMQIPEIDVG